MRWSEWLLNPYALSSLKSLGEVFFALRRRRIYVSILSKLSLHEL